MLFGFVFVFVLFYRFIFSTRHFNFSVPFRIAFLIFIIVQLSVQGPCDLVCLLGVFCYLYEVPFFKGARWECFLFFFYSSFIIFKAPLCLSESFLILLVLLSVRGSIVWECFILFYRSFIICKSLLCFNVTFGSVRFILLQFYHLSDGPLFFVFVCLSGVFFFNNYFVVVLFVQSMAPLFVCNIIF